MIYYLGCFGIFYCNERLYSNKNTDKIAVYISRICNVYTNGTAGIIGVVPDIPFYKINTSYRMIYE